MRALFILLFLPCLLQAQQNMHSAYQKVHELIFRLQLDAAENQLDSLEKAQPDAATVAYFRFTSLFLKQFVNEDPVRFKTDRKAMDNWLDIIEDQVNKNAPLHYLYLGEMNLQLAALNAKNGNTWSAGQYALKSMKAVNEGHKKFPDYTPLLVDMGLLNVAVGSLPNNYQFLISILGYSGNVDVGMHQIKSAMTKTQSGDFSYMFEKNIFLYGYVIHQLQPEALENLEGYGAQPDQNALLAFLQAKVLQNNGQTDDVIDLLYKARSIPGTYPFPYLDYMLGKAKLSRGDLDANLYLQMYLRNNESAHYTKSTLRYLYWHYLLRDNEVRAESYRLRIPDEGSASMGADREAEMESRQPQVNLTLLRARLAFDAGQYDRALELLRPGAASLCKSDADRLEFHYRKGRIYQATDQLRAAIQSYEKAIRFSVDPTPFSRVNAELQLGFLHEKRSPERAKMHFEKVLEMNRYPWMEGTQQKARAGLARLDA